MSYKDDKLSHDTIAEDALVNGSAQRTHGSVRVMTSDVNRLRKKRVRIANKQSQGLDHAFSTYKDPELIAGSAHVPLLQTRDTARVTQLIICPIDYPR